MNKLFLIFILLSLLISCKRKEELEKYDKNGKLIVYSEEVYAKMWVKNKKNLNVTVIDTFCINQKKRALKDIKNGKLIYFGNQNFTFDILSKKLKKYGIETKKYYGTCIRMGSFERNCYENEMWKAINKKFGKNFIDSLLEISKREFVLANPNIKFTENGIDLREKYKTEKKNSH